MEEQAVCQLIKYCYPETFGQGLHSLRAQGMFDDFTVESPDPTVTSVPSNSCVPEQLVCNFDLMSWSVFSCLNLSLTGLLSTSHTPLDITQSLPMEPNVSYLDLCVSSFSQKSVVLINIPVHESCIRTLIFWLFCQSHFLYWQVFIFL